MKRKKQLNLLTVFIFLILCCVAAYGFFVVNNFGCVDGEICLRRLVTDYTYSWLFVPLISLLFSTIPFYFTPKKAYKIWKVFAVIAIPIIAFLIYKSPEQINTPLNIGADRETTSMILSVVFVVVSWLIAGFGALRRK